MRCEGNFTGITTPELAEFAKPSCKVVSAKKPEKDLCGDPQIPEAFGTDGAVDLRLENTMRSI